MLLLYPAPRLHHALYLLSRNQTGAVLYFESPVDALGTLLAPNGQLEKPQFLEAWKSVNDSLELAKEVLIDTSVIHN